MYYSKLSNAFNRASGRDIDQKFPSNSLGFSKQRPEWEIVGAFAPDPVPISSIISEMDLHHQILLLLPPQNLMV